MVSRWLFLGSIQNDINNGVSQVRPERPVGNRPGGEAGMGLHLKGSSKARHSTAVPALRASSVRHSHPELTLGAIPCRRFAPDENPRMSIHFGRSV
jgi:hypothetical protein